MYGCFCLGLKLIVGISAPGELAEEVTPLDKLKLLALLSILLVVGVILVRFSNNIFLLFDFSSSIWSWKKIKFLFVSSHIESNTDVDVVWLDGEMGVRVDGVIKLAAVVANVPVAVELVLIAVVVEVAIVVEGAGEGEAIEMIWLELRMLEFNKFRSPDVIWLLGESNTI